MIRNLTISMTLLLGCADPPTTQLDKTEESSSSLSHAESKASPPVITLTLKEPNLLFRYLNDGKILLTTDLEKIPNEKRHAVYVDNLDISPNKRMSERYLQRYDLSNTETMESYVGTPVLRQAVEAQIERMRPKTALNPTRPTLDKEKTADAQVTLYSTKSCGYCRKARQFLTQQKVPFTEKDIEDSGAARKELESKARRAGVQVQGVPVIDVNGQIIPGFNPQAILKALDS